jgi:hypothetical protein
MMLLTALAIWFLLVVLFVALCRIAATADGGDSALIESYPTASAPEPGSAAGSRALAAGLVLWEAQPAPAPREERARARDARGRAGRYAAGS